MYIDAGLHVCMATIVNVACWEQENAFEAQELEVHVSIWNQTLVLCKKTTSVLGCRAISTAPKMLSFRGCHLSAHHHCEEVITESTGCTPVTLLSMHGTWVVTVYYVLRATPEASRYSGVGILHPQMVILFWEVLEPVGSIASWRGNCRQGPKMEFSSNSCQAHCLLLCFHYTSLQPWLTLSFQP